MAVAKNVNAVRFTSDGSRVRVLYGLNIRTDLIATLVFYCFCIKLINVSKIFNISVTYNLFDITLNRNTFKLFVSNNFSKTFEILNSF